MFQHQQDATETALSHWCHCGATGGLISQTPAGCWPQTLPDWSLVLHGQLSGSPLISYNTDEHPDPATLKTNPHINFLLNAVIEANGKNNFTSHFKTANIDLLGNRKKKTQNGYYSMETYS